MSTQIPPLSKREKRRAQQPKAEVKKIPDDLPFVRVKFVAADTGDVLSGMVRVPGSATVEQLELLLNDLHGTADEPTPYEFTLQLPSGSNVDIDHDIYTDILQPEILSSEELFTIAYTPKAVFKVRAVSRPNGAGMGHGATILAIQFAPHTSTRVVTGAGDNTARIWNSETQLPITTLAAHKGWVLAVSWSPCGSMIATGSHDGAVHLWDGVTGKQMGRPFTGHKQYITSICWEPLHLCEGRKPRFASSSKDSTVRVWSVERGVCDFSLSGHRQTVSCVKWGGFGDIYSASHDRTIKIWSSRDGTLTSTLQAHAHWVNHLALSTDYVVRTGFCDHRGRPEGSPEELRRRARERFEAAAKIGGEIRERLVSASDDCTMFFWEPRKSSQPLSRMAGHQKQVNHVAFSPDGLYIASASFDNSVKLWQGRDGKFLASLRGHVAAVYQCAWSSDSRLLVSCSKDTTVKVWDVKSRKLKSDLSGHADEVYAVDWSVDGSRVCSGGKDKTVRFWSS